jgi:hypothetical protein
VEDRLLQRAVARIVGALYEQEFLDCSFGSCPRRNPYMALKALAAIPHARRLSRAQRALIGIRAQCALAGARAMVRHSSGGTSWVATARRGCMGEWLKSFDVDGVNKT